MKPPGKPSRAGVTTGVLLMLSPWAGFLVTAHGPARAFPTLGDNGLSDQQVLAQSVGLSLRATAVGLALCPVGGVVLMVSLVLRARARRQRPPSLTVAPAS